MTLMRPLLQTRTTRPRSPLRLWLLALGVWLAGSLGG